MHLSPKYKPEKRGGRPWSDKNVSENTLGNRELILIYLIRSSQSI